MSYTLRDQHGRYLTECARRRQAETAARQAMRRLRLDVVAICTGDDVVGVAVPDGHRVVVTWETR